MLVYQRRDHIQLSWRISGILVTAMTLAIQQHGESEQVRKRSTVVCSLVVDILGDARDHRFSGVNSRVSSIPKKKDEWATGEEIKHTPDM